MCTPFTTISRYNKLYSKRFSQAPQIEVAQQLSIQMASRCQSDNIHRWTRQFRQFPIILMNASNKRSGTILQ